MTPEPGSILNEPKNNFGPGKILGIDESGKGDFFGPLVIAGVLADEAEADRLREIMDEMTEQVRALGPFQPEEAADRSAGMVLEEVKA